MSDDLVKRLRMKRERCHDLSGVYYTEDMDCQAAADRIEALEAEVKRLRDATADALAWLEKSLFTSAEHARAMDALKQKSPGKERQ